MRSFWNWSKAGCLLQHWNFLLAQADVEEVLVIAGLQRLSGLWEVMPSEMRQLCDRVL